ncbi:MAG TPA: HAD-IIIC family phosphatase [Bryobacteraceae bacterium]|nr:HAD-IIIC family phosphatase [Bryobacteraceae bacterium]
MTLAEALRITSEPQRDGLERRVFLVTGFEPLQLQTFVAATARKASPDARWTVETGTFGSWRGNLDRAAASSAEAVLGVLDWPDLDPRLGARASGGWTVDIVEEARTFLAAIRRPLSETAARKRTILVPPVLSLFPLDSTAPEELGLLGSGLRLAMAEFLDWVVTNTQVTVAAPDALDDTVPPAARRDLSLDFAAGHPLATACASALAGLVWKLAFPEPRKKGIITDLDNTLWRGVLGEDGLDGIAWTLDRRAQVHSLYQRALASLASSGVLVGVATKNDPALAKAALSQPGLLVDPERIFPVEAGWGAKSEAVGRILQIWNVAADSVIFVDDSPHELEEVRAGVPGVECLRFDRASPAAVLGLIRRLRGLFGKRTVSIEDRLRSASIRTAQQAASEARAADPETFLRGLGARIWFDDAAADVSGRSLELLNKTNQFNMNGRHYSQAEWHDAVGRDRAVALSVRYADKFGPLGQVGTVLGRWEGRGIRVEAWVLSCRAFSRRIEHATLRFLLELPGVERLQCEFRETERNGPFRDFLDALSAERPSGRVELARERALAHLPPTYHTIEMAPELTYARSTTT